MINFKQVSYTIGTLLCIESFFLLLSSGVSLYYNEYDLPAFLLSFLITLFAGTLLVNFAGKRQKTMGRKEGLLVVSSTWFVFSLFGALPFYISRGIPVYVDAFFETVSGFTTTGSSLIEDLDSFPHGLLFWRSLIQWLGGMGIVVFTLAVLPLLTSSSGGLYLFNFESTGLVHSKLRPRIDETAKRLWGLYVLITLIVTFLLCIGPMDFFDALCHSLTTAATGGYSTKNIGVAYWNSPYTEWVIGFFMLLSGSNFTLIFLLLHGKIRKVFADEEWRSYLFLILCSSLIVCAVLQYYYFFEKSFFETLRISFFQVTSAVTSTGFSIGNELYWGNFLFTFFLFLMLIGGSSGGTAGGIKVIRFIVLIKNAVNEFHRNVRPNVIVPVRINRQVVSIELVFRVLAFLSVYVGIVIFSLMLLSLFDIPFERNLEMVISALGNMGFSLGGRCSSTTYLELSPFVKCYLAVIMVVGRLELFTVLTLFTPYYWKR
ncbi:MAG TPA: potassium transporter [Porphyromonadaceae bacterium]|nr:potassium transporter [Porphyromonadaceae bacterium]